MLDSTVISAHLSAQERCFDGFSKAIAHLPARAELPKRPVGLKSGGPMTACLHLMLAALPGIASGADAAGSPPMLPEVQVVDAAPLSGFGVPLNQLPANVQTLTHDQLSRPPGANLGEILSLNVGSVNINDTQGNPYQPNVNFRGFTASPILGTPTGMSVFVDGVRVNEAFGDTVNWDLIPKSAIASVTLLPGSNPVFGLNTLGGALVMNTKNGFQFPGTELRATGGSFGRRSYELVTGGHGEHADYFLAGSVFDDDGWGQHNPSRVNQWYAQTGIQGDSTQLQASFTYADTRLAGNQTLPLSFFNEPSQAYTFPDITANRLAFFNLKGAHTLSANAQITANAYYRSVTTRIFNSNINDDFNTGLPPGPGNQPAFNAINNIGETRRGGSFQLTALGELANRRNSLTLGISYDRGDIGYTQFNQEAPIAPDRDTTSPANPVLRTSLRANTGHFGLYITDTYALNEKTHLTVSGRYNRATLELQDQLGTALNGDHRFQRLNPAVGLTYNPLNALTTYVSYNEGMRIPTPVELTCSDRNAPCSLPNAFSADPPLNAVVSKTREFGARGRWKQGTAWSAAVFRTDLSDDIQFISSGGGATSAGYFQNVGATRRTGLELSLDGKIGRLDLSARYSQISATFRTPLVINSPSNSAALPLQCPACSDIQVMPGNRIPGIPRHLLKLRADYRFAANLSAGASLFAAASQYARGDENNLDVNGPVPGYAVVSVDARYNLARNLDLMGTINNIFNRQYQTFGLLGHNVFTAGGHAFDYTGASFRPEQFRAAAAPRAAWIGIAYRFSAK